MNGVAESLARAAAILERRPSAGVHDDSPASARWLGGLNVEARHPNGQTVLTGMPTELGGAGGQMTPGWLVRSGVAACAATTIASLAALEGVTLDTLEVYVTSQSDTRGLLGLAEADGVAISPGPLGMQMHVRIGAAGVSRDRLRAIVELARSRAPMTAVVQDPRALELLIEVAGN